MSHCLQHQYSDCVLTKDGGRWRGCRCIMGVACQRAASGRWKCRGERWHAVGDCRRRKAYSEGCDACKEPSITKCDIITRVSCRQVNNMHLQASYSPRPQDWHIP
jgi:hypothetical protein